jgi:hypothetical protein
LANNWRRASIKMSRISAFSGILTLGGGVCGRNPAGRRI